MLTRRLALSVLAVALFARLAPAQADDAVLLKYKVAKGDTQYYKQTMTMKQKQKLSIMGMEINQDNKLNQEAFYSRVADAVGSDGKVTYKLKAVRRKADADFGMAGKFEFDSTSSERDTGSVVGGALTPLLERTTGAEYEVTVGPLGQVTGVKGYAELIADVLKDNPLAGQFGGGGDNASAAMQEQDSFIIFSEKPVKPGEKWSVPFELELPKLGKFKGTTTYTYEGPDKVGNRGTARIAVSGDMSFTLDSDQGGMKISGTLSSTAISGTVHFDPEAGRILSIKRNTTLSGQLTVVAGDLTIPIDNQQEMANTYEALDKLP